MALVPLRTLLDHAAENNYGVAAFNVNNMEQIQAIMEAADETDSPVIIQASRGARAYSQDAYLRHLMLAAVELYPQIPVTMHQDHGNSVDTCKSAIDNGFTSVMMDGSLEGRRQDTCFVRLQRRCDARRVVEIAHPRGVSVEGELGCLGSLETGQGRKGRRTRGRRDAISRPIADRSGTGGTNSSRRPASMRWPSPSGPVTVRTSSLVSRTGEILAIDRIEANPHAPSQHAPRDAWKFVRSSRIAGHHQQVRRRAFARLGEYRSKRFSAESSTACARSTSTPTIAWRLPERFVRCSLRLPRNSIPETI